MSYLTSDGGLDQLERHVPLLFWSTEPFWGKITFNAVSSRSLPFEGTINQKQGQEIFSEIGRVYHQMNGGIRTLTKDKEVIKLMRPLIFND